MLIYDLDSLSTFASVLCYRIRMIMPTASAVRQSI
jgi:hypothetical protein